MKKLAVFLTMLSASVLLSALTAFSSSGPFGAFGPNGYTVIGKGAETPHGSTGSGTGPYGAFGYMVTEGGVKSIFAPTPGGSGPYGAFDIYGMKSNSGAGLSDGKGCIVTAMNCPTKNLPNR